MTHHETESLLQDLIRHLGRSLLQYASESFPWTTPKNHSTWLKIQNLVKEEQLAVAKVTRTMIKQRMRPPYLGAYPMNFTDINYLTLDHLLPMLIAYETRRGGELEKLHNDLYGDPVRPVLSDVLDLNRRQLQAMRDLLPSAHPEPTEPAVFSG